jgi:hypothetical protein
MSQKYKAYDKLQSLEQFIKNFQEKDAVQPISNEEIQAWLESGSSLDENLYYDDVYDLYLDKFVEEYWRSCTGKVAY